MLMMGLLLNVFSRLLACAIGQNTICYFDTGSTFHRHRWTHLSSTQVVKIANHVWRESYNHNFFSGTTTATRDSNLCGHESKPNRKQDISTGTLTPLQPIPRGGGWCPARPRKLCRPAFHLAVANSSRKKDAPQLHPSTLASPARRRGSRTRTYPPASTTAPSPLGPPGPALRRAPSLACTVAHRTQQQRARTLWQMKNTRGLTLSGAPAHAHARPSTHRCR
jgi:hypothetical protein